MQFAGDPVSCETLGVEGLATSLTRHLVTPTVTARATQRTPCAHPVHQPPVRPPLYHTSTHPLHTVVVERLTAARTVDHLRHT